MLFHLAAFAAGFVMDLIFGDPLFLPHPVRFIGKTISFGEKLFYSEKGNSSSRKFRGLLEVLFVCAVTEIVFGGILFVFYRINPFLGCGIEAVMTYQLLATKCLKTESMKVFHALENSTIEDARKAVSMIVGRDTENLSDEEVTKAAVETVAENTSDGITAPMIFLAAGGPLLGFFYKAVNTMDSMIGYKNTRYIDFGCCAARLDDFLNFLPSRISALLMLASCAFLGKDFSQKEAFRIWRRDRLKHESPNSAQTESVCAGALGIRLAGPAVYEGKVEEKFFLGDSTRKIEHMDIARANRLLYATAFLCEGMCVLLILALSFALKF